jgi:hypothetical protein
MLLLSWEGNCALEASLPIGYPLVDVPPREFRIPGRMCFILCGLDREIPRSPIILSSLNCCSYTDSVGAHAGRRPQVQQLPNVTFSFPSFFEAQQV